MHCFRFVLLWLGTVQFYPVISRDSLIPHGMGTLSTLLAFYDGNPLVTVRFPSQRTTHTWLIQCLIRCYPRKTVEQTDELPVIWDAMTVFDIIVIWRQSNVWDNEQLLWESIGNNYCEWYNQNVITKITKENKTVTTLKLASAVSQS